MYNSLNPEISVNLNRILKQSFGLILIQDRNKIGI